MWTTRRCREVELLLLRRPSWSFWKLGRLGIFATCMSFMQVRLACFVWFNLLIKGEGQPCHEPTELCSGFCFQIYTFSWKDKCLAFFKWKLRFFWILCCMPNSSFCHFDVHAQLCSEHCRVVPYSIGIYKIYAIYPDKVGFLGGELTLQCFLF